MQLLNNKGSMLKVYSYLLAVLASITLFENNAFATSCDTATTINSLPYYITSPGTYCLADSMTFKTTSNSSIAAITISATGTPSKVAGREQVRLLERKAALP